MNPSKRLLDQSRPKLIVTVTLCLLTQVLIGAVKAFQTGEEWRGPIFFFFLFLSLFPFRRTINLRAIVLGVGLIHLSLLASEWLVRVGNLVSRDEVLLVSPSILILIIALALIILFSNRALGCVIDRSFFMTILSVPILLFVFFGLLYLMLGQIHRLDPNVFWTVAKNFFVVSASCVIFLKVLDWITAGIKSENTKAIY